MPERNSNHLSREKSPYLLQHADNPVDWYPWGPEAFEKAVREGKPVLLSIGYSTCHWCHVMAHESFENKDIAAFLNEHFVSIKVDREERPDIDSVYMNSVVAITGQGGWPLTVFLSPDQKPFFGGTYFPPSARWGQPGFMDLLRSIQDAWQNNRGQVIASGESLTELLQRSSDQQDQAPSLNSNTLDAAYHQLASGYDQTYGGFGSAPKFPMGHNLGFLLRYAKRSGRAQAGGMVEKTLQFMAQGGIYDHLAGGFHRYSTDPIWQVPHFEKMLYDQALLARAYLEGYQVFRDPAFADIAREVLDYVARDLKDPQGGFYSAEDADSLEPMEEGRGKSEEKKEGAFYIWSVGQLKEILSAEEFKVVEYYSDIHPEGNAQQDPHGEFVGKNIFYQARSLDETAGHLKMELQEVQALLRSAKSKLLQERNKRPRPHLDDKVLTDWNGLMIASFAYAANVLHEPKYARTACEAADFILNTLMDEQGTLLHRYRDGEAKFAATLEDYAFLVWGLLELYQATFDSKYLKKSAELADKMVKLFWDDEGKGFFMTAANAEQLIVRPKEIYDGAVPSGNSAALYDLVLLYHLTFEDKWQKRAEDILNAFAGSVAQRPSAYCFALWSLEYLNARSMEIILTGELSDNRLKELLQAVHGPYIPHKVIHVAHTYGMFKGFKALDDFVSSLKPDPHQPKAYVCENQTCRLPVADVQTLKKAIEG